MLAYIHIFHFSCILFCYGFTNTVLYCATFNMKQSLFCRKVWQIWCSRSIWLTQLCFTSQTSTHSKSHQQSTIQHRKQLEYLNIQSVKATINRSNVTAALYEFANGVRCKKLAPYGTGGGLLLTAKFKVMW